MDANIIIAVVEAVASVVAAAAPPVLSRSAASKIIESKRLLKELGNTVAKETRTELRNEISWEVNCMANSPWKAFALILAIETGVFAVVAVLLPRICPCLAVPYEVVRAVFAVAIPITIVLFAILYDRARKGFIKKLGESTGRKNNKKADKVK